MTRLFSSSGPLLYFAQIAKANIVFLERGVPDAVVDKKQSEDEEQIGGDDDDDQAERVGLHGPPSEVQEQGVHAGIEPSKPPLIDRQANEHIDPHHAAEEERVVKVPQRVPQDRPKKKKQKKNKNKKNKQKKPGWGEGGGGWKKRVYK
jgi:hypothetical protein